jgi:hypothetical protein
MGSLSAGCLYIDGPLLIQGFFWSESPESVITLPIGRRCSSENRAWTLSLFVTMSISRRQFGASVENFQVAVICEEPMPLLAGGLPNHAEPHHVL